MPTGIQPALPAWSRQPTVILGFWRPRRCSTRQSGQSIRRLGLGRLRRLGSGQTPLVLHFRLTNFNEECPKNKERQWHFAGIQFQFYRFLWFTAFIYWICPKPADSFKPLIIYIYCIHIRVTRQNYGRHIYGWLRRCEWMNELMNEWIKMNVGRHER